MANPDDEDNEDLADWQRRILKGNARKSGASIGSPAEQYARSWPNYCRACAGIGGHKAGPDRLPTECPECYGAQHCGRCAAEMPQYETVCPSCGWRVFTVADALPGANFV